ncbi:hypothetical protein M378DRAFT_124113 [Amanita muscaria Koide BX008]|uniref:HhH-GPD domain-containing protein n=1 Tax=Amanita muscaria (strain Koide BX008) TaxID=946122 RepID=A0A0C2TGZ1_AMAMK|nr:hypothetical protein M378DRAFT_124113 [Amanita muscaria Koide BX008]
MLIIGQLTVTRLLQRILMVETRSKRKASRSQEPRPSKKSRTRKASIANSADDIQPQRQSTEPEMEASQAIADGSTIDKTAITLPATLTFSFEDGKQHLISVDRRFEKLFNHTPCKPFEELETVHPFSALAASILGQQISSMAARTITHRFKRLFDPTLPENPVECVDHKTALQSLFFPSPQQVGYATVETLKSAGLSTRKAEYVKDLAARFADGRLSPQKLAEATDEELMNMLIEVRGIGKSIVDMFSIFSMRRPDILPVGDLGVQRGILRWFLEPHSALQPTDDGVQSDNDDVMPPPLPEGLNVQLLKGRLTGKKVRGAFLTPLEMEEITRSWKPYRSLGVYYMWNL